VGPLIKMNPSFTSAPITELSIFVNVSENLRAWTECEICIIFRPSLLFCQLLKIREIVISMHSEYDWSNA